MRGAPCRRRTKQKNLSSWAKCQPWYMGLALKKCGPLFREPRLGSFFPSPKGRFRGLLFLSQSYTKSRGLRDCRFSSSLFWAKAQRGNLKVLTDPCRVLGDRWISICSRTSNFRRLQRRKQFSRSRSRGKSSCWEDSHFVWSSSFVLSCCKKTWIP